MIEMARNGVVVGGIAIAIGVYSMIFRAQHQKTERMLEGIDAMRKAAFDVPYLEVPPVGIPSPPVELPADSAFATLDGFEFAYWIEATQDGKFIHRLVGRSPRGKRDSGRLSQAMLLVMRRWLHMFVAAGLQDEVMLHVDVHERGTQHIDFVVTPEQHARLRRECDVPESMRASV